jgi:hypothetical protein
LKTPLRQLAGLGSFLFIAVAGFAQTGPSLNGTYAVLASAKQYDSFGETGGAILSVLNFDGAGNVSGTAVLKGRTGEPRDGDTGTSAVQGAYTPMQMARAPPHSTSPISNSLSNSPW